MAQALDCPHCGGALPPRAVHVVVTCPYCQRAVSLDGAIVRAAAFERARARDVDCPEQGERVRVAGQTYVLGAHVASGASAEVWGARRVGRCAELVILKRLRADADADLLDHEWRTLTQLARSTVAGHQTFRALVPEPVAKGDIDGVPALVTRARSGFVHTLDDALAVYPRGLDPRHVVWIWRRILEVLAFAHRSGMIHGAVLPEHVLLHARDHGAKLVGWSAAVPPGEPARLMLPTRERFYPRSVVEGAPLEPATDLVMAARTVMHLGGAEGVVSWPLPIRELLEASASRSSLPSLAAMELHRLVAEAAGRAYGPPRFVHLAMPGW